MIVKCEIKERLIGRFWKCACLRHNINIKVNDGSACLRCKTKWKDGLDMSLNELGSKVFSVITRENGETKKEFGRISVLHLNKVVIIIGDKAKTVSPLCLLDIPIEL